MDNMDEMNKERLKLAIVHGKLEELRKEMAAADVDERRYLGGLYTYIGGLLMDRNGGVPTMRELGKHLLSFADSCDDAVAISQEQWAQIREKPEPYLERLRIFTHAVEWRMDAVLLALQREGADLLPAIIYCMTHLVIRLRGMEDGEKLVAAMARSIESLSAADLIGPVEGNA